MQGGIAHDCIPPIFLYKQIVSLVSSLLLQRFQVADKLEGKNQWQNKSVTMFI